MVGCSSQRSASHDDFTRTNVFLYSKPVEFAVRLSISVIVQEVFSLAPKFTTCSFTY